MEMSYIGAVQYGNHKARVASTEKIKFYFNFNQFKFK